MTVKLKTAGWEISGTPLPWIWGQINYWDIERSHWRDVLRAYYMAGHRVLSVSVLPGIHQTAPRIFEFGSGRPQYDLGAFLQEAREIGLQVMLWVGPRDVPGSSACGYPQELLHDREALARDAFDNLIASRLGAGGETFALPSLVSRALQESLQPFAQALTEALAPYVHPDGPVIGLGLTQAPGWQAALAAFAADYQSEALHLYRQFLKKKYARIAQLKSAYGQAYASFSEIEPPRRNSAPENFPDAQLMDWAQFREEYFILAAEIQHNLFSPLAFSRIPVILETIPTFNRPNHWQELERSRCFDYCMLERPDAFAGQETEAAGGCPAWGSRFLTHFKINLADPLADEFHLLRDLARGVRGWDALSPAGSGTWPGFVTDRQGMLQKPQNAFWERLKELAQTEGVLSSQLHADVFLLTLPEMERSLYLHTSAPARRDLAQMPMPDPQPQALDPLTSAYRQTKQNTENFLRKNHFAYMQIEGEFLADRLNRAECLIVPGAANMLPGMQKQLVKLVEEEGRKVVIIGSLPEHPQDAAHTPLAELAAAKPKKGAGSKTTQKGRLFHQAEFSETALLRLFQHIGIQRPLILDHQHIRLYFHKLRNRVFVAAVNPGDQALETVARREGKFVLKDFWHSNRFLGGNHEIKIILPARSVKFWELIPC